MEEAEVPLENVHEEIHRRAEESQERWILRVALSSALLAAFAAVASLLAGHHANEAVLDQIAASDLWSYYQAKGVKSAVLSSKMDTLDGLGKGVQPADSERLKRYEDEEGEVRRQAEEKQAGASLHLRAHTIFARGVTMFQVAIAVAAISVLTKRRAFWYLGLAFGVLGIALLIQGCLAAGSFLV